MLPLTPTLSPLGRGRDPRSGRVGVPPPHRQASIETCFRSLAPMICQ